MKFSAWKPRDKKFYKRFIINDLWNSLALARFSVGCLVMVSISWSLSDKDSRWFDIPTFLRAFLKILCSDFNILSNALKLFSIFFELSMIFFFFWLKSILLGLFPTFDILCGRWGEGGGVKIDVTLAEILRHCPTWYRTGKYSSVAKPTSRVSTYLLASIYTDYDYHMISNGRWNFNYGQLNCQLLGCLLAKRQLERAGNFERAPW